MSRVVVESWGPQAGPGGERPEGGPNGRAPDDLEWLAWLMDRAFVVPGTNARVGLDAMLGLLPGIGDVLAGMVQVGIVLVALKRYKVPKFVAMRMMANVLVDTGLGAVPLLGDAFDAAFKANTKNLKLLEPYRDRPHGAPDIIDVTPRPKPTGLRAMLPFLDRRQESFATPMTLLIPVAIAMIGTVALVLIGFITVVRWIIQ